MEYFALGFRDCPWISVLKFALAGQEWRILRVAWPGAVGSPHPPWLLPFIVIPRWLTGKGFKGLQTVKQEADPLVTGHVSPLRERRGCRRMGTAA